MAWEDARCRCLLLPATGNYVQHAQNHAVQVNHLSQVQGWCKVQVQEQLKLQTSLSACITHPILFRATPHVSGLGNPPKGNNLNWVCPSWKATMYFLCLKAITAITADCFSVSDTNDCYSDSGDSFFVCEIQQQATTSSPKAMLYADSHMYTSFLQQTFVLKMQIVHYSRC